VRGVLQEDFAFWVLCSTALAAAPVPHVAGLLFLLVSFWAIYERGYVDNDASGARFEAEPKLSAAFHDHGIATPRWTPWLWALCCGAIGAALVRWPDPLEARDMAAWVAVLVATQLWFTGYNRVDKSTRVWLFAGLQFARAAAFVALVPIVPIGAAALGAHVLGKWVPYHVYRLSGKAWPEAPFHLIRLMFFVVLAALLTFALGWSAIFNVSALALLVWNLFRAQQELATAIAAARRLDRPPAPPQP